MAVLLILATLPSCSKETGPTTRSRTYFDYFDTVSSVYSYAGDSREQFEKTASQVDEMLKKYHRLLDIYNEYEGMNNLCTLNRNAGVQPVELDPFLLEYLYTAKEYYTLTDGEMNIMMGNVLSIWHNCRENGVLPSSEELKKASEHTSIDSLVLDLEKGTAFITDSLASTDAGAMGKGFAAEKIAARLESGYVVDIGGNIRLIGTKANGESWYTGIKNPENADKIAVRLSLADTSCVTSGNYERYVEIDGKRYSHIIDRDTLMPADYYLSVSVITKDSGLADALATALSCMSIEKGLAIVNRLENVQVLWILPDMSMVTTEGFEAL
jgi:thiamine biosynthesis lipoprotein